MNKLCFFSHLPIEHVQGNNLSGILLDRGGYSANPQWAASTNHDYV